MRAQRSRLHDKGWAFLPEPNRIEEEFWRYHDVAPVAAAPESVVVYVNQWLDTLEPRP
jgi:hypothetical protein